MVIDKIDKIDDNVRECWYDGDDRDHVGLIVCETQSQKELKGTKVPFCYGENLEASADHTIHIMGSKKTHGLLPTDIRGMRASGKAMKICNMQVIFSSNKRRKQKRRDQTDSTPNKKQKHED